MPLSKPLQLFLLLCSFITLSSQRCVTDEDCSLNGICLRRCGKCVCDPGWKSADCGVLDTGPAKRSGGYNRTGEGISSWCNQIVHDPHDPSLYHLFLSEFADHCGLDYWSPYSRIIRAESRSGPEGPYTFAAEVVSSFAHNPTLVYSKADNLYLLYYIGCPQTPADVCTGHKFSCGPGNSNNGESGISVQSSPDLRTWTFHGQVFQGTNSSDWDADVTNPSPLVLHGPHDKDSTMLLAYRGCPYNCEHGEQISLALSPTGFEGPYTRVQADPIFSAVNEDPFLWRDKRGNYHLLLHSLEPEGGFGKGPKVGRHAFARHFMGPWTFNNHTLAFSTEVKYDDGTVINFYRRERPVLYFSDDGDMRPLFLSTGVQEVGNPMSYSVIVPVGN